MARSLVDESILDGIPDHLIRPLLAISIRATRAKTIAECKQLLNEIKKLTIPCGEAGGESLYYIRVRNMVSQRMSAMIDAEQWARKTDPTAAVTGSEINRWSVDVFSNGQNHTLLVTYERAGVNYQRREEKLGAVVTVASETAV